MNFEVIEVKVPSLNYGCHNPEKLAEGAEVHIKVAMMLATHKEKKDLRNATLNISILLVEDENTDDPKEITKEEADGFFIADYKLFFKTDMENSPELENIVMRWLEPYFNKGLLDFSNEVGIPPLNIPYGFLENAQKEE
ncbi:hypothetical protein [Planococcus dechangensis]|uniref:Uncharacterized protein n=1 Tax=Planococcus dechangensis TaxID=1176255 RepID=A0ABV9MG61_9BACL